jgi:hypothetical protein
LAAAIDAHALQTESDSKSRPRSSTGCAERGSRQPQTEKRAALDHRKF